MNAPRKVSALIAAAIASGGAVATASYFYVQRSIQPRSGTVEVAGLEAPVEVSFDDWAIPTVMAGSERDLFRAQGFVHASERLWQLEFFRRLARGELAEIFGPRAVEVDRLVRTLDLWGTAGAVLETLPPADLELLEAYAGGVNDRIRTWRGPLPPEFLVLGIEPRPWSPRASLAIGQIMSLDLAGIQTELARATTLARVPASHRELLDPAYPAWGPTIFQDSMAPLRPVAAPPGALARGETGSRAAVGPGASGRLHAGRAWDPVALLSSIAFHASNSWAVGPSRTADGSALLASDMHLSLRAPSTWYINALHARESGLRVAGLSIPGAPGVVVGFNDALAWAFTNAMLDDADLVVESVNLDGSMYADSGGWEAFRTREERIAVRGGDTVVIRVRRTRRGPVISDPLPAAGLTLSLLWTGLEPRGAASAILNMNRARDPESFRKALEGWGSPHQNVIYATADGRLGYRLAGSIPYRSGVDGSSPIPFERLPDGWPGFWSPDSMPEFRDPPSGYLASANNLQARHLFGVVGVSYPLPFRARRIVDVVSGAVGWTPEDMRALQLDTRSLWAERLLPRAIAAARRVGEEGVASALGEWDRRVTIDSPEATWFYLWLYRLRGYIAFDELDGTGAFPDRALDRILDEGDSPWVDDVRTAERERLETLEERAMRYAIDAAAGRTWGEVHRERSVHPLAAVAWLDRLFGFDVGPYPAPGGRHTVRPDDPHRWSRVDSTSWTLPIESEYGPSERFVAHLGPEGVGGGFLLPTGQAGNPADRHYRDMARVWREGSLVPVPLDPGEPRANERARLRLVPGSR